MYDVKKNEDMRISNQVKDLMIVTGKLYCSYCHRYYNDWMFDDEQPCTFSHTSFEITSANEIVCKCNVSGRNDAILIEGKKIEDKSGLIMSSLRRLSASLKNQMTKTETL